MKWFFNLLLVAAIIRGLLDRDSDWANYALVGFGLWWFGVYWIIETINQGNEKIQSRLAYIDQSVIRIESKLRNLSPSEGEPDALDENPNPN